MTDNKNLHDLSAEYAADVVSSLNDLTLETIPDRISGIQLMIADLIEAMRLVDAVHSVAGTEPGAVPTPEGFRILKLANAAIARLQMAEQALLWVEEFQDELSSNFAAVNAEVSTDWKIDYFTSIYRDPDREEKISRLNSLIRLHRASLDQSTEEK